MRARCFVFLACVLAVSSARAQSTQRPVEPVKDPAQNIRELNENLMRAALASAAEHSATRRDYQIGPEDLVEITVFEVPELSRAVRVSAMGEISLPLIGPVKASGLSPLELERLLMELLRRKYIKDPQVTVFLKEFKSDPVSVMGAVKMPGLYHIQTQKTLIEVLAMAQGLSEGVQRHPGRSVVITHKPRPRVGANGADPSGSADMPMIEEIPLKELLQSGDPKLNVAIYPGDVVRVVQAGTVYVAGDVNRPGGFPLTDFDNISAIQALAMAGGTKRSASSRNGLIIRIDSSGKRTEEKLNLSRILKGKDADIMLGANDILFIPGSVGKESALRAIEMGIQTATGMLIWRR